MPPLVDPPEAAHELHGCPFDLHWQRRHGDHCSCRLLAEAAGADASSIDYTYCRSVLQRRWRIVCNHVPVVVHKKTTPEPPPHKPGDPLHALLIANADISSD
jgi:phage terminase large subunit GpA-like protein